MDLHDMRNAMRAMLTALVCVVSGACADGTPPPKTSADSAGDSAAAGKARGVVPIAFEAKKPGQKQLVFALVDGKVGDVPTRFILDTGAPVHVIDTAVAETAKVGAPAGAAIISIDGWGALPAHAIAVHELPAPIRGHGIGGIISPQLLAEAGQAVVIDLANHQLRTSPKSTAWTAVEDVGALLTPPAQRKVCPADVDGIAGVALAIDGVVDGEPTRLTIDTGASRSLFLETSKAGERAKSHPVLGRTLSTGSSNAEVATSIYGGVPMTVGAWSQTVDVGVMVPVRPLQCGSEGRLGMDVLHDCALAITSDEVLVGCRAATR